MDLEPVYLSAGVWLFALSLWWTKRLGAPGHTALFLGGLSVFNPYMVGLIHSGLTEYMGLGFGVLFVLYLRERKWLVVGIWLMILGLQSFVVGLIASLFGLLHLLNNIGIPNTQARLWKWGQVIIPSLCVVVPFGILCLETFHDPHALFTPMDAPGWEFCAVTRH